MAKYVQEIINPQLFFLGARAAASTARGCMVTLGISGIPILDDHGVPVGFVSMRDVAGVEDGPVKKVMSTPVKTVPGSATVEAAALLLAETGLHRLVAVDEGGRALGVVSSIDVIRGLIGAPIRFPERFHHRDPVTGLEWRGDYEITAEHVEHEPSEPGLIVLRYGARGLPEVPIWVGMTPNIRATLDDMLREPRRLDPLLAAWMEAHRAQLRFRTAVVRDDDKRRRALEQMRAATKIRAWVRELVV